MEKPATSQESFDPRCSRCARLVALRRLMRQRFPAYHNAPVAPFGDRRPRLMIVGLAPGMHGANASGRPFTGDYAGIILYKTLYDFGFSSAPESVRRDDGLSLNGVKITNAVKCLPPENKPTLEEIKNCNRYLAVELQCLQPEGVILALGKIAHDSVLRALGCRMRDFPFGHGQEYRLEDRWWLIDSYHCSRYNTQTRRLTPEMFSGVFRRVKVLLGDSESGLDDRASC